jgi:hypothetical protein
MDLLTFLIDRAYNFLQSNLANILIGFRIVIVIIAKLFILSSRQVKDSYKLIVFSFNNLKNYTKIYK